jgi:TRAP-type uncharacterized transport system fused permease subunit
MHLGRAERAALFCCRTLIRCHDHHAPCPTTRQLQELEQKFDPEMRFRPLGAGGHAGGRAADRCCRCFHYYTAGFGPAAGVTHRGVHLAFVLGLIFLVFPHRKALLESRARAHRWLRRAACPGSTGCWPSAVAVAVLYIPYIFDDLAFRVGNPGRWTW